MQTLPLRSYLALSIAVTLAACSNTDGRRGPVTPTAPTFGSPLATAERAVSTRGDYRTNDVLFPPRNEAVAFRQNVLEDKFRDLGRPLQTTFVNAEGLIVWLQEYLRYRVNGCSQQEAIARVFAQIDGGPVQPVCNPNVTGSPAFPPQSDSIDFRQQLEAKYRDDLRAPPQQTYVDAVSEIIYTQEYLRYRLSGCANINAWERVVYQINGFGVLPDCNPQPQTAGCSFSFSPNSQNASAAGGAFNVSILAEPATCKWQVISTAPFITGFTPSGSGTTNLTYTIAPNTSTLPRAGSIRLDGDDTTAADPRDAAPITVSFTVNQSGATPTPTPTPPPAQCTYQVGPTFFEVVPGGGEYDVQVTTQAGCAWTAASTSPAIVRVTSGASSVGTGAARFTVVPNEGEPRRAFGRITSSTGNVEIVFAQSKGAPPPPPPPTAQPPVAVILGPPNDLCIEDTDCGEFRGNSSTGAITSYSWNFGDGTPAENGVNEFHTYSGYVGTGFVPLGSSGLRNRSATVALTVTGPGGSNTAQKTITVYENNLDRRPLSWRPNTKK